jgi:hypothetical protein
MKEAEAIRTSLNSAYPDLEELSTWLDNKCGKITIETVNWVDFDYKPEVSFTIAYSRNEIFLKFYVTENHFKAEKTESNQEVYEDSCVEFFVMPEDDEIYYNLEFNGIGTCLLGSGTGRADNKRADTEVISQIRRLCSAGRYPVKEKEGEYFWTITIAIPVGIFYNHSITELKGKRFRANFYKCGDKLTVPHYVTWNPVRTEKPDFHQPEYFGSLKFV